MISYIRFFVYLAFLAAMIGLGVNNQQLRANVDILKGNIETQQRMLEIKNVMLNTLERNLHSIEKISAEREEQLEKTNNKLKEATILLEMVYDETEMPDSAFNVLRSLGIVRNNGTEGGSGDGVQADVASGTVDGAQGSSDNTGKEVQRPAEMEH